MIPEPEEAGDDAGADAPGSAPRPEHAQEEHAHEHERADGPACDSSSDGAAEPPQPTTEIDRLTGRSKCDWVEEKLGGVAVYYNVRTGKSSIDKPAALEGAEQARVELKQLRAAQETQEAHEKRLLVDVNELD